MFIFLTRRLVQMFILILLASIVSYGLLYLAPGGPVEQLRQQQQQTGGQQGAKRITQEDIARIKQRFELDLYLPVRYMRWLVGMPRGPLQIAGQTYFADIEVGCRVANLVRLRYADGTSEVVERGCKEPVRLADLEGRRTSRGILFGDLGRSQQIARDQPISTIIWSRLPYTMSLMGTSILLAILIGVPIGIYSAVRPYSRFDTIMTTTAFIGASMPSFFFGILAILAFAVLPQQAGLPHLPSGGAIYDRDKVIPLIGVVRAESTLDYALHFILPCAVLTFISIAGWSRFVRSSMIEVLNLDYVRTARAKGLRERAVVLKHALRNALIPFVTLLAGVLPALVAGAAITEAVFDWPGMGQLLIQALQRSDYTVAMSLIFVETVLLLLGILISDILYQVVDPRIRIW